MEDREIISRIIDRDENGAAEMKRRYEGYMTGIARRVLKGERDAEECVSDALVSAWNDIPKTDPVNLRAYLGTLVKNEALSRLRTNSAMKRGGGAEMSPEEELDEISGGDDVPASVEGKELSRLISDFLRNTGETARNMFIRRYWFEDSVEKIALRFGCGESKVKMTLKRTRDKLAKFLKKEGYL